MTSAARDARDLRAYLADVGGGLPTLPWRTPAEAEGWLGEADRRRLDALRRRIAGSWLLPAPHLEVVAALAGVDPAQAVALYPGAPPAGPSWFVHNFGDRERPSAGPIANQEVLPVVRLYELDQIDPFADRPVACAPLFAHATTGNHPLGFVQRILIDNGLFDQLRIVLYERGRVALFAGWYRPKRARRFDERDHALLLAARPALRAWARAASAVGVQPLSDGALAGALAAIAQPALLLRRGRIVFANERGRSMAAAVVAWDRAGRPAGFASTTPLRASALQVDLVLPDARTRDAMTARSAPPGDGLGELPPSLQKVASLLARGLADKEIASELGVPLATVRTYVARALKRLDVRGRRELMVRLRAADNDPAMRDHDDDAG